jgi:thioredoxin-like negative regulator of GroEL
MVAPMIAALAQAYAGRAKLAKLNVEQNQMTSSRYHVQSLPTLLFFKNGQLINRLAGSYPKDEIERQLLAIM